MANRLFTLLLTLLLVRSVRADPPQTVRFMLGHPVKLPNFDFTSAALRNSPVARHKSAELQKSVWLVRSIAGDYIPISWHRQGPRTWNLLGPEIAERERVSAAPRNAEILATSAPRSYNPEEDRTQSNPWRQ